MQKRSLTYDVSASDSSSFVQLFRQAGLFAVRGILMMRIGVGRVGGYSSIELTNGSTHAAFNDAILQVFLLADLHALLRGLDIRQLSSPPLRILKKPSHGIISCLSEKCNPFRKKNLLTVSFPPVRCAAISQSSPDSVFRSPSGLLYSVIRPFRPGYRCSGLSDAEQSARYNLPGFRIWFSSSYPAI